ncbi:MAG: GIY-YIG nuclease family protein [Methanobrevibacter sp.]|nr:GIY-YIG nuclease family protein [Methanobrevibacter sp.]
MYGYIYITTNTINGMIYIGQHKSESFDKNYYGSGIHLLSAIDKYGKENFKCEIIEECCSKEELDLREIFYINKYNSTDINIGYNISLGGSGIWIEHHTDETKQKISKANKGKVRTDDCKKYLSKIRKNSRWINNGVINKHVLSNEVDYYISNGWVFGTIGKRKSHKMSDETKKKISISNKKPKLKESVEHQKDSLLSKKFHWYTNGFEEILVSEFDSVPEGFNRGRLPVSDEFRKKCGKRPNKK